jgi:hypothetical protein
LLGAVPKHTRLNQLAREDGVGREGGTYGRARERLDKAGKTRSSHRVEPSWRGDPLLQPRYRAREVGRALLTARQPRGHGYHVQDDLYIPQNLLLVGPHPAMSMDGQNSGSHKDPVCHWQEN